MNYADPFGIQESTPLSRALRRIHLDSNQTLNWPAGYLGPDYIASINLVEPSDATWSLTLPNALGANEGTGFLIVNKGTFDFDLLDFTGVNITTLTPGQAKYLYCEANDTESGTWHTVLFGEGVSTADAIELAGSGLRVTDGRLSMALTVSTSASDITVNAQHRGRVLVNNGGSVTINLPQYNVVGNDFFFCVHNGGGGTVTLQPATSNTIDDYASMSLAPNESVIVCCSGTNKWYTIGYGRSTQFQFTKLVKDVSAGGTLTLTSAEASNKLLQFTGSPTTNVTIIVPSVVGIYYVQNTYSGPNSLTLKTQSGAGLSLNSSDRAIVYCDGVNVVSAQSVAVGVNLSVVDGSLNVPSISFSSDQNTGMYKADFDTVGLVSNGAEAARFAIGKSSVVGKLGVGTSDPVVRLHAISDVPEVLRLQANDAFVSFYNFAGVRNGAVTGLTKELRLTSDGTDSIISLFASGDKRLEVNKTGIKVFGTVVDGSNNSFATLGNNSFTGMQVILAQRSNLYPATIANGIITIDSSKSTSFYCNVVSPARMDFINKPPPGQDQTMYIKVRNGAGNVTFGSMCKFPNNGLRPSLSSGVDVLAVWYDPNDDCFVVGLAFPDYRA